MSLKAKLRSLEKQAEERFDRCARCGGLHARSWLSLAQAEERGEDLCACEECGCARFAGELARLAEED